MKAPANSILARVFLAFLTTAGVFYINYMPAMINGLKEALNFSTQNAGFVSSANQHPAVPCPRPRSTHFGERSRYISQAHGRAITEPGTPPEREGTEVTAAVDRPSRGEARHRVSTTIQTNQRFTDLVGRESLGPCRGKTRFREHHRVEVGSHGYGEWPSGIGRISRRHQRATSGHRHR